MELLAQISALFALHPNVSVSVSLSFNGAEKGTLSFFPIIASSLQIKMQILHFTLIFEQIFDIIILWCCHNGRRLVLIPEDCDLCLHRNPFGEILRWRTLLMLTIDSLIGIISLCLTCFSLGYSLGKNSKTQK